MNGIFKKYGTGGFISVSMALLLISAVGCSRGQQSERTPIHLNPNMDIQEKYLAQGESKFFANGSNMRLPVEGTISLENLRNDDAFFRGMNSKGEFIKKMPVEITMQLLDRGEQRFNIYCSPCHSRLGDGKGIMVSRGYVPPPSFHTDLIRNMPDGQIFDVITHGIRNMPAYRYQVPPADRWAIIAYIRALQRSQDATIKDIPEERREKVKSQ